MRISDLDTRSAALGESTAYFAVDQASSNATNKIDYNALARAIIEQYAGSTIGGTAQSVKAAVDKAHNLKLSRPMDASQNPYDGTDGQFLRSNGDGTARWDSGMDEAEVSAAVAEWLEENISGGQTIAVDKSLTVADAAADAKVAGDELNVLRADLTASEKTVLGYNFVHLENETKTSAGITFVSDGATIIANGTAASNSIYQAYIFTPVISGSYRLSGCPVGGAQDQYYLCFDKLSTKINCDFGAGVSVSLTAGETYTLWVVVARNKTVSNIIFTPSLIFEKTLLPESNRGLIDSLLGELFDATSLVADVTSAGWALVGNGSSVQSSNCQIKKYTVSSGDKLYLKLSKDSAGVYQWQNAANVPTGTNTNLIGTPVTDAVDGIVEVPTGATYLIISEKTTNTYNVVKALVDCEKKELNTFIQSINPVFLTERFISHRGLVTAPENTIPAIKEAITSGYKITEFDVRFTSDNVAVLIHDDTINRTARNMDGTEISETIYVNSVTYDQLQQYDFGIWKGSQYAGTKIPTLEDALKVLKKHNCCGDIDLTTLGDSISDAQIEIVLTMLRNYGVLGYCMITDAVATIQRMLLFEKELIVCASNLTSETAISEAHTIIRFAKLPIVSLQYPYATQALYDFAHELGIMTKSFTLSDNNSINSNLNTGTDFQIIDTLKRNEIVLT